MATTSSEKTPAQLMQEQHESNDGHRPTVEDAVDEEDVLHPPPSQESVQAENASAFQTNGTMSANAAGKQKASDKPAVIDTHDEAAFPSLGAASKPTASPATRAPGWVASASAKSAGPTGGSRPASSGVPPPSSTPVSAARGAGGNVMLPGRHRDSFEVDNADLDKDKSIRRVLDDVKKKFNVIVTPKSTNFAQKTEFVAEGPKARVTDALMYMSKELTLEKQVKLEIPSSVSAQIIGKAGANIKKLESNFNVKIRIDRDTKPSDNADHVRLDVVEIRGHSAQVRQVYEQISNQVKQLEPRNPIPLRNIPPEFYPFIAGRHAPLVQKLEQDHDLRITVPTYHTWQQQAPASTFVPHGDSHIIVHGDSAGVQQARLQMERIAQQLQKELILEELACEQILHPFIVGDRGMDPLQFLEETGCVVVLPPSHHETEEIHIIGPQQSLEAGRNRAMDLMSQKHNRAVDLQKHFHDAPEGPEKYSRALARYLQQKAIEREFLNSHNAELVFPQGTSSWNVITSDQQKAVAARNELSKITQAYPTSRLSLVSVDPFYHPHLAELHAQDFRQNHGVQLIVPDDSEEPVILVYEGPAQDGPFTIPRSKPTKTEIATFEKALEQARTQLLDKVPHGGITSDNVNVPRKFHDKVRKLVKDEQQPQAPRSFPVQVDFGTPRGQKGQTNGGARAQPSDSVFLRGPSASDIAELRQKIEEFLLQAEEEEKERGYNLTFDFPAQYNKNLIGKQGQHIKTLRDKHDVEIDTRDTGKIKITGPQKKAEACKAEIIKLGKQWEDEVNYSIKVEPKWHGMLVGRNGENLQKIQSKVNNDVRIDFPRVARVNDDQSVADGGSDFGGGAKSAQASDEIRIRGPRAKADKVRDELLSLHQWLMDNSHTATVSVAQDQIPSLIGRRGQEMEKLRADTGAQIDIPKNDTSERVTIQIKGTKQQVDKARQELQKRAKAFDDIVVRNINVDRKHHRTLIGGGGSNIQSIVTKAGGTGTSAEHVQFPRQGQESDSLTVKGTADVVDKILASIQSFIDEKENQTTETIDVPINQHRNLIGQNGSTRKKLEEDFSVSINVPRQGSGQTGVKIAGLPANVSKAKEHITSTTSKPQGETIMVPRAFHHVVAKYGALFRELSRDGINIDHNGQKPPQRPKDSGKGPRSRNTNGDMPLITDQPGEASHSWDIVSNQEANGESGEIPWVILVGDKASEDAAASAKRKIENLIAKASEPQYTGYLILPDPRQHRHIIGQGGSTINSIRKKSGCDIQVPNKNSGKGEEGEAITIVGQEKGVLEARDLILEEISKAGQS